MCSSAFECLCVLWWTVVCAWAAVHISVGTSAVVVRVCVRLINSEPQTSACHILFTRGWSVCCWCCALLTACVTSLLRYRRESWLRMRLTVHIYIYYYPLCMIAFIFVCIFKIELDGSAYQWTVPTRLTYPSYIWVDTPTPTLVCNGK